MLDFKRFEDLFELAANQARAIQTLYSYGCIKEPTFIAAKESLQANLRMILCGSVPITKDGKTGYSESAPACIDAYRTIALYTKEYSARIEEIQSLSNDELTKSLGSIEMLPEINEHKHEPIQVVLVDQLEYEATHAHQ